MTVKDSVVLVQLDEAVLGVGVVGPGGQVFTPSTTINAALSRPPAAHRNPPSTQLTLRAVSGTGPTVEADLVKWQSPARGNISTLLAGGGSIDFATADPLDPRPVAEQDGVQVLVLDGTALESRLFTVTAVLPSGSFRVRPLDPVTGSAVLGCPVVADGALVGVLSNQSPEGWFSVASVTAVRSRLLKAEPRRGTASWALQQACGRSLDALFTDLKTREETGIPTGDCDKIKAALKKLSDELDAHSSRDVLGRPLVGLSSQLYSAYEKWNGYPPGPAGADGRKRLLSELRDIRRPLTQYTRQLQESLLDETLAEQTHEIMQHFRDLVHSSESSFRSTSHVVSRYFRVAS